MLNSKLFLPPMAICQEIFKDDDLPTACRRIRSLGYEGIELAPFMLARDLRALPHADIQVIKKTLDECDLVPVAFHWLLASPKGMSITSPDPAVRNETISFFTHLIKVAKQIGVPLLVFGSPAQRNIDPSWDPRESFERGVDFFREMAGYCGDSGMHIAFEHLGTAVTNFGATFDDAMEIIHHVSHPAFGLHLDMKAMHSDRKTPGRQIHEGKDYLLHVHANDPNLLGPGMGDADIRPVLEALLDIEYKGWISVETFREDIPPLEIAAESMRNLQDVFKSIMDVRNRD